MKTLILKNNFQMNMTMLPNSFVDHYMANANGEFVKVYLFLLRHVEDAASSLSISMIADYLNNTENDVLRAFRYWESVGLLRLGHGPDGGITSVEFLRDEEEDSVENTTGFSSGSQNYAQETSPVSFSAPVTEFRSEAVSTEVSTPEEPKVEIQTPVANAVPLDTFRAQKEMRSLLFIAEQYLGKTLTHTDVDTITYFYDTLHMSADLIEYLIESCVENGHKSMHYIQKVAISWAENGVETVSQAKEQSAAYSRNCYTVLNAFGIKNRGPATSELEYINKWADHFGFSADIIQEACRRTISAIHQPSFEYADRILTKWYESNIRHLTDINALDNEFQKERSLHRAPVSRQKAATRNLNNFERRSYDMDSLEEQLLKSN